MANPEIGKMIKCYFPPKAGLLFTNLPIPPTVYILQRHAVHFAAYFSFCCRFSDNQICSTDDHKEKKPQKNGPNLV